MSDLTPLPDDPTPPTFAPVQYTYLPRTTVRKLMPAIILLSGLALFIASYYIADSRKDLLGIQFLLGTPLFIGGWVGYFANYTQPTTDRTISGYIFYLLLAIIAISFPVLKEGTICMVMLSPILFFGMWIGAMLMDAFCEYIWKSKALHSVAILPLLVLFVPIAPQDSTYEVKDSIVIHATPQQIWQSINHVDAIAPDNFYQQSKLLPFMGVPTPKSANTVWQDGGWVRKCEWHGGIHFDEPIVSQIPNQQLRWQFKFYPDSVPKGTLDDHVTLNGEHFKLLLGQYDITPLENGESRLTFTGTYRITTNINAYAGLWGKWVMGEFSQDVLNFYKRDLESKNLGNNVGKS